MALSTLKLDETGDLILDAGGRPDKLYKVDAASQLIHAALSLWLGNWFADLTRGMDWLKVMQFNFNRAEIITLISDTISKLSFVSEIVDVSLKVTDRVAEISYTVIVDKQTVTGNIPLAIS